MFLYHNYRIKWADWQRHARRRKGIGREIWCNTSVQPFYPSANIQSSSLWVTAGKAFLLRYWNSISIKRHDSFVPTVLRSAVTLTHTFTDAELKTDNHNHSVTSICYCCHWPQKLQTDKCSHYRGRRLDGQEDGGRVLSTEMMSYGPRVLSEKLQRVCVSVCACKCVFTQGAKFCRCGVLL